jgi:anti-anti-sigma factor
MKEGTILYLKQDNVCFIKMYNAIKYSYTSGFDKFIYQLSRDNTLKDVLIDLNDITYIDSTNLGLLAEIATVLLRRCNQKPKILSTNKKITEVIENIGLDKIFLLITNPESFSGEFQQIRPVGKNEFHEAKTILNAHKNLIRLNENNAKQFKNVVDILEDQLDGLPDKM